MTENEWQPIETAPRDGQACLLYGHWAGEIHGPDFSKDKVVDIGCWSDGRSDYPGNDWWCTVTGDAYACWVKATHWMPLPSPPTDNKEQTP